VDAVRPAARALVAGPHQSDLIELVARRCAKVTGLLLSVGERLAKQLSLPNVSVVAGSLDGLEPSGDGFGVVLAADGLDPDAGHRRR
jgi:hypothetical protein